MKKETKKKKEQKGLMLKQNKTKHTVSTGLSQNSNVIFSKFITFKESGFSILTSLLPYQERLFFRNTVILREKNHP